MFLRSLPRSGAKYSAAFVAVLFLAVAAAAQNGAPSQLSQTAVQQQIVNANRLFCFHLLAQLEPGAGANNIFISPMSLMVCLSMARDGSGGQTNADMAGVLGLSGMDEDAVDAGFNALIGGIGHQPRGIRLALANGIWVDRAQEQRLSADYQRKCRKTFGAEAQTLDFHDPASADKVNSWVKKKTSGSVPTLVTPNQLAASDTLLVSAVYFHGMWAVPFDPAFTKSEPFTRAPGDVLHVSMMLRKGALDYCEDDRYQAVSVPYAAGTLRFDVILPKASSPTPVWPDAGEYSGLVGKLHSEEITLLLPRIQANCSESVKAPLTAMGMGRAFGSGPCDFTPMGLSGDCLGDVVHDAVLTVDENGTTAAGATATMMTRGFVMTPVMNVDHPFFCAIRDSATGLILFAGILSDPG